MGIFKKIFNHVSGEKLLKSKYAEHEKGEEPTVLAREEKQEENLQKSSADNTSAILFSGGQSVRTPPNKPVNIKQAGILAEKLLKGD